jgi:hypothetical protein
MAGCALAFRGCGPAGGRPGRGHWSPGFMREPYVPTRGNDRAAALVQRWEYQRAGPWSRERRPGTAAANAARAGCQGASTEPERKTKAARGCAAGA